MVDVVRASEDQKSHTMVMTGEGREGKELSWCDGTETGDAPMGR